MFKIERRKGFSDLAGLVEVSVNRGNRLCLLDLVKIKLCLDKSDFLDNGISQF